VERGLPFFVILTLLALGFWCGCSTESSVENPPPPSEGTVTYMGKTYHIVQIGTQYWLKENLDVGTMILGSQNQTNNGRIDKYCYHDSVVNCDAPPRN
jgi:hypothetical protein